ncbi:MAG: hypothetical protein COA71_12730 [SAR86 cluster bacterium]|uniref:Uncharacterized protein n=1 Tax=SAR86 cluster bacterium TaxID=2030880 RepID=A0A2A5C890_9GAMM|nr:MAG: hypothetical protein COA71_12730 [SAR86 cluster bacterium]
MLVKRVMSKIISFVILIFVYLNTSHVATAQILQSEAQFDNVFVDIDMHHYGAVLPSPFNAVEVVFDQDEEKNLTAMKIHIDGIVIEVEQQLLIDISNVREPFFYYSAKQFQENTDITDFGFILNHGESTLADVGAIPGCESPCMRPRFEAAIFVVDTDHVVSRQSLVRD